MINSVLDELFQNIHAISQFSAVDLLELLVMLQVLDNDSPEPHSPEPHSSEPSLGKHWKHTNRKHTHKKRFSKISLSSYVFYPNRILECFGSIQGANFARTAQTIVRQLRSHVTLKVREYENVDTK